MLKIFYCFTFLSLFFVSCATFPSRKDISTLEEHQVLLNLDQSMHSRGRNYSSDGAKKYQQKWQEFYQKLLYPEIQQKMSRDNLEFRDAFQQIALNAYSLTQFQDTAELLHNALLAKGLTPEQTRELELMIIRHDLAILEISVMQYEQLYQKRGFSNDLESLKMIQQRRDLLRNQYLWSLQK